MCTRAHLHAQLHTLAARAYMNKHQNPKHLHPHTANTRACLAQTSRHWKMRKETCSHSCAPAGACTYKRTRALARTADVRTHDNMQMSSEELAHTDVESSCASSNKQLSTCTYICMFTQSQAAAARAYARMQTITHALASRTHRSALTNRSCA
jgi:hypothetical protein